MGRAFEFRRARKEKRWGKMAIAFTKSRPFHTIPIVGATSTAQLASTLTQITLPPEVLAEIAATHRAHPQPY